MVTRKGPYKNWKLRCRSCGQCREILTWEELLPAQCYCNGPYEIEANGRLVTSTFTSAKTTKQQVEEEFDAFPTTAAEFAEAEIVNEL